MLICSTCTQSHGRGQTGPFWFLQDVSPVIQEDSLVLTDRSRKIWHFILSCWICGPQTNCNRFLFRHSAALRNNERSENWGSVLDKNWKKKKETQTYRTTSVPTCLLSQSHLFLFSVHACQQVGNPFWRLNIQRKSLLFFTAIVLHPRDKHTVMGETTCSSMSMKALSHDRNHSMHCSDW